MSFGDVQATLDSILILSGGGAVNLELDRCWDDCDNCGDCCDLDCLLPLWLYYYVRKFSFT